jgi:hypothetical protein
LKQELAHLRLMMHGEQPKPQPVVQRHPHV